MRAEFNVTNLRKIEKGKVQPGVMLAVRLVAATGANVGEFFQKLAETEGMLLAPDKSSRSDTPSLQNQVDKGIQHDFGLASVKCVFGPLFKETRVRYQVTQKLVAEKAQYNLRNILAVESGKQEPGVMTALAMVCAVGADIKAFFTQLREIQDSAARTNAPVEEKTQ